MRTCNGRPLVRKTIASSNAKSIQEVSSLGITLRTSVRIPVIDVNCATAPYQIDNDDRSVCRQTPAARRRGKGRVGPPPSILRMYRASAKVNRSVTDRQADGSYRARLCFLPKSHVCQTPRDLPQDELLEVELFFALNCMHRLVIV